MKEFNPCPIFGKKHLSMIIEYEQPSNLDDKLIKTWNAAVQKK